MNNVKEFERALRRITLALSKRISIVESKERAETAGAFQKITFANLPVAGKPGRSYFCTNGLKVGEATGNGTGVPVYDDGTGWFRYSDDTVAAA